MSYKYIHNTYINMYVGLVDQGNILFEQVCIFVVFCNRMK